MMTLKNFIETEYKAVIDAPIVTIGIEQITNNILIIIVSETLVIPAKNLLS